MTQDNRSPDPASAPSNTPNTPADEKSAKSRPERPRKKRWVRRIFTLIGGLILLLVVLVLLAPTILSTGAARTFVVGKVNDHLNGKVAVGGWSIGWRNGITADDVKVFDANRRQILQIPRFHSGISLLGLAHGQIHLGNTTIEGLDFFAEQNAQGILNFSKLARSAPAQTSNSPDELASTNESPGKVPSIDGELHLVNCRGTFQDDQSAKTIQFTAIAGDVKIPSRNSPIGNTINGAYPADKPMNKAIVALQSSGEFAIELSDTSGVTLKSWTLPFVLSNGKFRVAYAGKPAGQDLPPAADLNGGRFSIAGATIDLSQVHPTLTIPDGTKMLDGVGINPLFAQTYLQGWLSNPLFAGADKASAQLFVTMKHCDRLPIDALVEENVPANVGMAEIELQMTGLELGSKLVNQLNSALALVNPRGKIASNGVQLSIPQWTVTIEHGAVTQDLKLMIGRNPPMELAGTVNMKTRALNMILTIPISKDQGVKIPVTGTADDPKLDTKGLLEQNLKNIRGIPKELQGILGKKDDQKKDDRSDGSGK